MLLYICKVDTDLKKNKHESEKNKMQNKHEFTQIIEKAVESYELQGRSFTYGVALWELITRGWMNERMDAYGIYEQMELYVGHDLIELMESRGLDTSMRGLASIIDISVIQEIVENLMEEE